MFTRLYPKKNTNRDEFRLTLAGVLNTETKWSYIEKREFVKKLCKAAGDKEIAKAIEKLKRVEKNIERGVEKIWSTQHMSEILGRLGQDGGMDFVDAIRDPSLEGPDPVEDDSEDKIDYSKTISFADLENFLTTDFPKPSYIIEPLVSNQSIVEIVGASGVGKTMFGLAIAGAISTANGLLGMNSIGGPRPVLYVEGELLASDIKIRINGMFEKINRKCDPKMFYVSSLQQQLKINAKGFTPIQTEQGLIEIENAMLEIKKRTGKMPVVFIDNISCLASGLKENDADAWSPIINKFVKWKNMGSTVFYFHHLNKSNDSSGSTMQHRTIDMVLRMKKPDNKQKIKTFEKQGVQAIVDFGKWRLHDNSKHAQEHMLVCEDWKWEKLPVLTSDEIEIVRMHNEGLDVKEMSKEIDLAEKTIYKKYKNLKDKGVITNGINKQTINGKAKEIC
jgi:KaiC/GvpD/RAD55 family RecA-like ATPase